MIGDFQLIGYILSLRRSFERVYSSFFLCFLVLSTELTRIGHRPARGRRSVRLSRPSLVVTESKHKGGLAQVRREQRRTPRRSVHRRRVTRTESNESESEQGGERAVRRRSQQSNSDEDSRRLRMTREQKRTKQMGARSNPRNKNNKNKWQRRGHQDRDRRGGRGARSKNTAKTNVFSGDSSRRGNTDKERRREYETKAGDDDDDGIVDGDGPQKALHDAEGSAGTIPSTSTSSIQHRHITPSSEEQPLPRLLASIVPFYGL